MFMYFPQAKTLASWIAVAVIAGGFFSGYARAILCHTNSLQAINTPNTIVRLHLCEWDFSSKQQVFYKAMKQDSPATKATTPRTCRPADRKVLTTIDGEPVVHLLLDARVPFLLRAMPPRSSMGSFGEEPSCYGKPKSSKVLPFGRERKVALLERFIAERWAFLDPSNQQTVGQHHRRPSF